MKQEINKEKHIVNEILNTFQSKVLSGSYLSGGEVLFFLLFCTAIPFNYDPPFLVNLVQSTNPLSYYQPPCFIKLFQIKSNPYNKIKTQIPIICRGPHYA